MSQHKTSKRRSSEQALEKELRCTICLDTYTDPKILQCFHVYCQKCLAKLVIRDQQGRLSLSCPICRQVTPVPANGTTGLQSAFHINRLLEILDQHKGSEGESLSADELDNKAKGSASAQNLAIHCSEHSDRDVELFCESCDKLICMECAIKGGKHNNHDYISINESFERYKKEVTPSLVSMEKQMSAISNTLSQLDRHCAEIARQQGTVEGEIRESSKRLHEIIDKRQEELIGQLDQITRRKLKNLATQRDQIETLQAQLSSCLEFTKESLKTGIQQREVLAMKISILKQQRELTLRPLPDIFTLKTVAGVVFSGSADAEAVCESYGRVYTPNSPDPSKSTATGKGTEEAIMGEKATALLTATSFRNVPCDISTVSISIQAELVSELTGGRQMGTIEHSKEQRGPGQYVISYQPTAKGKHQLHITTDGQHITGSPFLVNVTLPVEKLGTPIQILTDLSKPEGIAVTARGDVVVTDSDAHCVSIFSSRGELLRSFGTKGSGKGELNTPSGVAVDGDGYIVVVDRGNHRLQKFDTKGNFLKAVDNEALRLDGPNGIAYSAHNNRLYVADFLNHCIVMLNSDLTFWGMFGGLKEAFVRPRSIATDTSGKVYVVDSGNGRIQVFTAKGKFLRMFGKMGERKGEFNFPYGIAVDGSGLVYVSEFGNHRVSVLTSEGKFVTSFGSKGAGAGQFEGLRELSVNRDGVMYVCDSGNHRIQMF